ncbi:hypothetical protein A9B99_02990 [Mangrovibacter phragmitis]|uniref:Uncharacterized protein n=1 Tax=Mangrovibacter phragmitis TaxID=1691903 RepID=A0A1B7L8S8_9ENTR|nr:hypothetical protein [Mangrovibacter phragmitis]OAT78696.1 hypothetical protein A9B99_02990 [Mangrovibacter phragmitis]
MLLSKNHSIVGLNLFYCSSIKNKLLNNIDHSGKNADVKYLLMHSFERVKQHTKTAVHSNEALDALAWCVVRCFVCNNAGEVGG